MANDVVEIRRGDSILSEWTAQILVDWAAGKSTSKATRGELRREIRAKTAELAGPSPSPAELALAESASLALFTLRMSEAHFASAMGGSGISLPQANFQLNRIDRAHARLVSSLKTLATIRRLALPNVQINVGQQVTAQQVNSPSPA